MTTSPRRILASLVCIVALAALVAQPASASSARRGTPHRLALATAPFRFFSPTSIWNAPLSSNAPLDPSSAQVTRALNAEIEAEQRVGNGPWLGTTSYSVPIYTVPAGQPDVSVRLASRFAAPGLREAFSAVPLPADAEPSPGTDGHLVLWQPSTDRLWEFWRLTRTPEGPVASWGGAMQNASDNPGVYGPEAWPGATDQWGASASSLSIAGGVITLEDLSKGQINHALAMTIPNVRAGVFSAPAKRGDGRSPSPLALPEGAHLRLDPKLNIAALHLPRTVRLIAEAAQRYGIFVRDGAGVVKFIGQNPGAGNNPWAGPRGYLEGLTPAQLLSSFPWQRLQLLQMNLHADE